MEERATKLFNQDTANLYYNEKTKEIKTMTDGLKANSDYVKINADFLSKLSQRDLPLAVDMLSKLTVNGQISQQTLNKIFTLWNSPSTSNVLYQMNGDLETFMTTMDSGRTIATDYESDLISDKR